MAWCVRGDAAARPAIDPVSPACGRTFLDRIDDPQPGPGADVILEISLRIEVPSLQVSWTQKDAESCPTNRLSHWNRVTSLHSEVPLVSQ